MTTNTQFQVGKTYSLTNGNLITVTDIGRRSFDNALLVSYRVVATGQHGDITPNALANAVARVAA